MNQETKTDVLIIGGGIAGCIAAIALVNRYHVTLIDKLPTPVERIGESLAPAAQRILTQLRLLENLSPEKEHQLFRENLGMQSYWGSDQVQIIDHLRNPDGLGRNLNRKAFETHLRATAKERGVNCIWPAKLHSTSYKGSCWQVVAKSDGLKEEKTHHIIATFVIDATGRQSHFARSLGIKREQHDKLMACWVSMPNKEENKMSTISASETGWWYSAVIPNNKRVLAFQTDSDLIERNAFKKLDTFLALSKDNKAITKILNNTNGTIEFHGPVAANSTRLEQVAGKQWAALGDATISFDPLSSQGMFHAMASALQLKALITKFDFIEDLKPQKIKTFQFTYTHHIDKIWKHYLKHKNFFYLQEMRWKESPFWKRRHTRFDTKS